MTSRKSVLLQTARKSGRCPPSLLPEDVVMNTDINDGFEEAILKEMDQSGVFQLAFDGQHGDEFITILEKAKLSIPSPNEQMKRNVLMYRRAILLALAGATPKTHASAIKLVLGGFLDHVKIWLDQVLDGSVGGVDLLLHLLSNIADLPVTKEVVKSSGMGKAVGSIEKSPLCAGTPNESSIKERVQTVKDSWHASVKARKNSTTSKEMKSIPKRPVEDADPSPSPAKKTKVTEDAKKASSSFSNLLKKVTSTGSDGKSVASQSEGASKTGTPEINGDSKGNGAIKAGKNGVGKSQQPKKSAKRVKWADHFGGTLTASKVIDAGEAAEPAPAADVSVNWSDRKKRDRMREKELLAKAKKAKLLDDEDGDMMEMPTVKQIQAAIPWHVPTLLPERPDLTKAALNSTELSTQEERMKTVAPVAYRADYEIPNNPNPLTDVEQALDMTSQSAAVVSDIPFFVPVPPAPVVEAPVVVPTETIPYTPAIAPAVHSTGASPEFVQALGLPLFLVGQDTQALQTLASSPSLLSTLVDAHGMYDQARLMSLVQTLTASNASQAIQPTPPMYGAQPPPTTMYGHTPIPSPYSQPPPFTAPPPPRNGFRNNNPEGNLHISGFGPTTTQTEIIALFSPYVPVDEVVMKGTFAFVNTSDPPAAQRAREALNGTLLGGMPVRINPAQRKNRDPGNQTNALVVQNKPPPPAFSAPPPPPVAAPIPTHMPPPQMHQGVINVDAVRDDRGNPATKNLFVAGYGPGTTEQMVRDLFGQHCHVIGVVLKGSFTFVNTSERSAAVHAREMLSNMIVNGGALRINFAKETGRLGTSFDLTYGPNTGPNAKNLPPQPQQAGMNYYGRG